jgi:hypothetical protein
MTSPSAACTRSPNTAPTGTCTAAPRSTPLFGADDAPVPAFDTTLLTPRRAVALVLRWPR